MSYKGCVRKHTPIVSEKQRRFFGAEYGRKKRGMATRTDMSAAMLKKHLKEAGGKRLPWRKKKKKNRWIKSALKKG